MRVDGRWDDLQVQAGREFEKRALQVGMEDAELQMEHGGCSGQFGCRREEGTSEMEGRDRSQMEELEWMEGWDALDE